MKNELNKKIKELCDSAGTEAARAMAYELTVDLDRKFDDRVAAGMSELDAYRDVLKNVDKIEEMLRAIPVSDAEIAMRNHREAAQNLDFYLGRTSAVMWVSTVIAFFLVGSTTSQWGLALLAFLWTTIGQILLGMVKRYNRSRRLMRAMRHGFSAILWVGSVMLYFLIGAGAGIWGSTLLLFPFAAIAQILLSTFLADKK